MTDFFEDGLPAVLPFEDPAWTVAVHLPGGVFVTENIVAHHRENTYIDQPTTTTTIKDNESKLKEICLHVGLDRSGCPRGIHGLIGGRGVETAKKKENPKSYQKCQVFQSAVWMNIKWIIIIETIGHYFSA